VNNAGIAKFLVEEIKEAESKIKSTESLGVQSLYNGIMVTCKTVLTMLENTQEVTK